MVPPGYPALTVPVTPSLGFSCWSPNLSPKPPAPQGPGLSTHSPPLHAAAPINLTAPLFSQGRFPHLHCTWSRALELSCLKINMSCTISNKFSHPINYLASTCLYKKGTWWGRDRGKSLERARLLKTAEEGGGPPPGLGATAVAERETLGT